MASMPLKIYVLNKIELYFSYTTCFILASSNVRLADVQTSSTVSTNDATGAGGCPTWKKKKKTTLAATISEQTRSEPETCGSSSASSWIAGLSIQPNLQLPGMIPHVRWVSLHPSCQHVRGIQQTPLHSEADVAHASAILETFSPAWIKGHAVAQTPNNMHQACQKECNAKSKSKIWRYNTNHWILESKHWIQDSEKLFGGNREFSLLCHVLSLRSDACPPEIISRSLRSETLSHLSQIISGLDPHCYRLAPETKLMHPAKVKPEMTTNKSLPMSLAFQHVGQFYTPTPSSPSFCYCGAFSPAGGSGQARVSRQQSTLHLWTK